MKHQLTGTTQQFAELAELLIWAFNDGNWSTNPDEQLTINVMLEPDTWIQETESLEAITFSVLKEENS